jgi:hypothetical protein
MALTYSQYVTELSKLCVIPESDTDFTSNLPSAINYAEERCYRELNLLATVVRDSSANVTANTRNFTLPSSLGRFVVVNGINVITPVGTEVSDGTRNALMEATRDFIDFTWPSNTAAAATTVPQYFAMITDQTVIFGPPPGAAFNAEVVGTIRPEALSDSNTSTYLSAYLPDLFLMASMVFMSGYMRNFGSQADDPKMAASWEQQYQTAFASANTEETRKRFGMGKWGPVA